MQTFHFPITLIKEALAKATNHYTYQISPKFLVNAILCAQPPDSMTSFARKQYLNAEISAKSECSYDWCELHTIMRQSDWCEKHNTLHANIELFFFCKKKSKSELMGSVTLIIAALEKD